MRIETSRGTAIRVARDCLSRGKLAQAPSGALCAECAGKCEDPVHVTLFGRPDPLIEGEQSTVALAMTVRCRRCGSCLRQRARSWADRAAWEIRGAARSFLITLTLSPSSHHVMLARAGYRDTVAARHAEISKEITWMFKRIRKSGARFRYMLVMEVHDGKRKGGTGANTGMPHYHLLVHENPEAPLGMEKTSTEFGRHWRGPFHKEWKWGFVDAKLIEEDFTNAEKAAWYTTKYLAKTAQARVRASVRYGREPENRSLTIDQPMANEVGTSADRGPPPLEGQPFERTDDPPTDPRLSGSQWGQNGEDELWVITQLLTVVGARSTWHCHPPPQAFKAVGH